MSALTIQTNQHVYPQQRYVIEVGGEAAGLVIQERKGFRFFAAQHALSPLNRAIFATPRRAEAACRNLLHRTTLHGSRAHEAFVHIP